MNWAVPSVSGTVWTWAVGNTHTHTHTHHTLTHSHTQMQAWIYQFSAMSKCSLRTNMLNILRWLLPNNTGHLSIIRHKCMWNFPVLSPLCVVHLAYCGMSRNSIGMFSGESKFAGKITLKKKSSLYLHNSEISFKIFVTVIVFMYAWKKSGIQCCHLLHLLRHAFKGDIGAFPGWGWGWDGTYNRSFFRLSPHRPFTNF